MVHFFFFFFFAQSVRTSKNHPRNDTSSLLNKADSVDIIPFKMLKTWLMGNTGAKYNNIIPFFLF